MNFGLAVFPVKEVQDFANSYRKRYDPHYTLIQPHITLRDAEEWDEEHLRQVIEHLEGTTQNLVPFTVEFNRFSNFYPVNNVIYMALADPQPFIDCHRQICQGILEEEKRKYHFTPHLTIGQNMSSDELHDVFFSLKKIQFSFQMKADRVHLLYQTKNEAWTAHQTFLFKG